MPLTRIPEVWRSPAGRLVRIREMSNTSLVAAWEALRALGYVSFRDWQKGMPQRPNGLLVDQTTYIPSEKDQVVDPAWLSWCQQKHHIALDAFAAELAYRRRHRIVIDDDPAFTLPQVPVPALVHTA
jgi:hypothetical protein